GRVLGALALLRATGPVGIASAVIIAIAILMAVLGTFIAPYDPNLPNLSLAWGAPSAGHLLAVTAAWRRGASDAVISSGLDILFAFPGILLAVLAAAVFGAGLTAAAIALGVAYTPYVARVLRGAA